VKRSRISPFGKKAREWAAARRVLKAHLESIGVTRCELRLPGCSIDFAMSFAHAKLRRHLRADAAAGTAENLGTAALACAHCHQRVEQLKPETMKRLVMAAIAKRYEIGFS